MQLLNKADMEGAIKHLGSNKARYNMFVEAVAWISNEDNPGDNESIDTLIGYLTVALVADLFNVSQTVIANLVWITRNGGKDS